MLYNLYLVSVLFSSPSLHAKVFYRKAFYPIIYICLGMDGAGPRKDWGSCNSMTNGFAEYSLVANWAHQRTMRRVAIRFVIFIPESSPQSCLWRRGNNFSIKNNQAQQRVRAQSARTCSSQVCCKQMFSTTNLRTNLMILCMHSLGTTDRHKPISLHTALRTGE